MPNPGGTPDAVVDIEGLGTADEVVDVDNPSSYVSSFNGRSGGVAPLQADYDGFFLTPAEGNAAYAGISEPIAAAHIIDAGDAHDASAVSNVPAGNIAATDVQAAINELDTEKTTAAAATAAGDAAYTRRASVATYAARSNLTSGNLTLNSVTFVAVPTLAGLTLSAASGDWVEVGFSGTWQSEAVEAYLDAVSIVSGSPVNSWGIDGAAGSNSFQGVPHWLGVPSLYSYRGGTVFKQLAAGDISAGTVAIGLRYRTSAAANKVLLASADNPIAFWARNHG